LGQQVLLQFSERTAAASFRQKKIMAPNISFFALQFQTKKFSDSSLNLKSIKVYRYGLFPPLELRLCGRGLETVGLLHK